MARTRPVDRMREVALSLPEAHEELTWEVHPTFRVRGRIFAIVSEDGASASVKASKEEQQALIRQDPQAYAYASYVGRFGWVDVTLDKVDQEQLAELVVEAWRMTAPKRVVAAYDGGMHRA